MNLEKIVCQCNEITGLEVKEFLEKEEIKSLEELIEKMPIGDKCESCVVDGFDDDGYSLDKIFKKLGK
jgi:NAD(P)H-nitrite reductase large subunit